MTLPEAAEYLGLSIRTMQRLVSEESIEYFRLGGRVYFIERMLLAYVDSQRRGPRSPKRT